MIENYLCVTPRKYIELTWFTPFGEKYYIKYENYLEVSSHFNDKIWKKKLPCQKYDSNRSKIETYRHVSDNFKSLNRYLVFQ